MRLYPDRGGAQILTDIGSALFYQQKKDEAALMFEQALLLAPGNEVLHHNLAIIYGQKGNDEKAEQHRRAKWDQIVFRGHASEEQAIEHMMLTLTTPGSDEEKRNAIRMSLMHQVPGWHYTMLQDRARNEAYDLAITKAIQRLGGNARVLDIGTGSGLLSMMAARAGAKYVIGCEGKKPIADVAKYIVQKNGFSNIRVIPKHSTHLTVGPTGDMPEKANVLISEIVDSTLVGEGIMTSISHAQQHLITPDAIIIPQRGAVMGAVLESFELFDRFRLGTVAGFDVSAFNLFHPAFSNAAMLMELGLVKHRFLTDTIQIFSVDFRKPYSMTITVDLSQLTFKYHGTAHAFAVWFRMDLDDDITVTNGPENNGNHWQQAVFLLPQTVSAAPHMPIPMIVSTTGLDITVRLKESTA